MFGRNFLIQPILFSFFVLNFLRVFPSIALNLKLNALVSPHSLFVCVTIASLSRFTLKLSKLLLKFLILLHQKQFIITFLFSLCFGNLSVFNLAFFGYFTGIQFLYILTTVFCLCLNFTWNQLGLFLRRSSVLEILVY